VTQRDAPPEPLGGELQPGHDVDRADVGFDEGADVADQQISLVPLQQRPDTPAEARDVHAIDRTVDDHDDPLRPRLGSQRTLLPRPSRY